VGLRGGTSLPEAWEGGGLLLFESIADVMERDGEMQAVVHCGCGLKM